jgi:hypothetical protein
MTRAVSRLGLVGAFLLLACSSKSSRTSDGGGATLDTKVAVQAAKGGEVSLGDHGKLTIPAGSLAQDVTITVSTKAVGPTPPEGVKLFGPIFEFGPSGTRFDPPAIVSLAIPPTAPGGRISVFRSDGNDWTELDTTISGQTAMAPTEHFSAIALGASGASCMPNPCRNNGSCALENGVPTCSCPKGFGGQKCEKYRTYLPFVTKSP